MLLAGADLQSADFTGANLAHANLCGADLIGAIVRGADCSGANLTGAWLLFAVLAGAKLSGADLARAYCLSTVFADIDLSDVTGLDSVEHLGPSMIGIETLISANGKIPEAFLRGCGMSESLIQSLPTILNAMSPIQFYSCFISYSHKDEEFVERLHRWLQGKGVRCWYAPHDLPTGARIRSAIDASIEVHDKLLLVLSEHSVSSDWVEQEVETALRREREQNATVLLPVRLDDTAFSVRAGWPAVITNTRNIGDFRKWKDLDMFEATLTRLLRDLTAVGSSGHGTSPAPVTFP